MRNKYPGICVLCKKPVAKGEGHFERHSGYWVIKHAACVLKDRDKKL